MKKLVSFLLVLALALSLGVSAFADGKETISVYVQMENEIVDFNTMEFFTNPETGINAQANVNVKFTNIPLNDWPTKMNLMFNDKPETYADVIMRNSRTFSMNSYREEELIIPLDELIDKYMPNYKALLEANPYFADLLTNDTDGRMYQLGYFANESMVNANPDSFLYINKTWLDNLGLAIPTTIEEMEAVLTAFKEKDADGNGDANDEIPFTGRYNFNQDAFLNWAYCWGLPVNGAYCYIQDDKVVDFVKSDVFRSVLETLSRWYANGLIDVEAVTQDANTVSAKLKTGKVGCFFRNAIASSVVGAEFADQYVAIMLPTAIEGVTPKIRTYLIQPDHGISLTYMAAERGEEHLAAVCRWIDTQYAFENMVTSRWGFQGEGWDYDENGMVVRKSADNNGRWPGGRGLFYGVDPDFYVSKVALNENSKAVQALGRMYQDAGYFEEAPYQFVFDVIPWTSETSAAFKLTYSEMVKFVDENSCKLVANGVTDEAWNDYLAACDSMQIDNYVAQLNNDYQTYKNGINQ